MFEQGAQGYGFAIWADVGCRVLHGETGCKGDLCNMWLIGRTTSRWMLGWLLIVKPRGRLGFGRARGAG